MYGSKRTLGDGTWGSAHIPLVDAQHDRFNVLGLMVSEVVKFTCGLDLSTEYRTRRIHDLNATGQAQAGAFFP